uniref:Uncharacterized protein n=1 Tax=Rhizophagus irregularis (strain DAOM 181602 / DAOM 197198 / MUCL 43194) TaxID=747089 RepID=U9TUW1_RHIID
MVCGSIAYEHYEKDTIRLGKIMFCYEGGCGRRSTQIRNMLMRLKKGNGSEGKKNELSRSLCRTKLTSSRHHVRDIFLYDIPKRWTEIQVDKKISDKTEKFIRWYDGKLMIKERSYRDRWQMWKDVSEVDMKKIVENESKYLKALTAAYPKISSKVIKVRPCSWKILTYYKLQQDLENTLTSATTKREIGEVTKERNGKVRGRNEKKPFSNDNKGIYRLVRLNRTMSKIGTDGLLEKKDKMRQEIIHPSVEPEEVEKIINDVRDDQKSSSPGPLLIN